MEEEINEGKFIEFGEYKGNLYGTSAETVKSLINDGFFCILTPHYQVRYFVGVVLLQRLDIIYVIQFYVFLRH